MYFKNQKYLKSKETFFIISLVLFSAVVRIPTIILFGDTNLENEWLQLVNNLINNKGLSMSTVEGLLLPNLWMPPLYAYYMYLFSFFNLEDQNLVLLILSSQIVLASISVGIFYNINKYFFSKKISIFSSLLFSLFPLNLYACSQISSATLCIFLAMLFYYYFFKITKNNNFSSIFIFAITTGLLILTRGEFVGILFLSIAYLYYFFKIPIKKILLIILITLITISPYLTRNYLIFDKIIIQASFGYNLWKGNNPNAKVEGSAFMENDLLIKREKIPKDKYYRIAEDKILANEAIKNIKNDPTKYLVLFFKKAASLMFIDMESSNTNYYNPINYIPLLILGVTSLVGIFLGDKKSYRLNYLILIFFFYIITFSVFFILPRYKLFIIPLQIIFTNNLITYVQKRFS
tara:strand:- start:93 stop:1307 length:1215 start_codon:yes stop_codon:yes gene_type:complete